MGSTIFCFQEPGSQDSAFRIGVGLFSVYLDPKSM